MKRSPPRPSPADLTAARDQTIPDVLPAPGAPLQVLFCGINPSLYSAATGWHFARPGNRFWPALHLSGFTPRLLAPREQHLLPGYGLGITNLVARATAQASDLDAAELRAGGERLLALVAEHRPRILAIAGVTAYRIAFAHPRATIGPQPAQLTHPRTTITPRTTTAPRTAITPHHHTTPRTTTAPHTITAPRIWVLPNPSGLNAHWTLDAIAAEFAAMRAAASADDSPESHLTQ